MSFASEARITHFFDGLYNGQPLCPRRGEWTIGDVIFLSGALSSIIDRLGDQEFSEDELSLPLVELLDDDDDETSVLPFSRN